MNILYTCNEYPPFTYGGQGVFVKQISEYLAGAGNTIIVYGVYPGLSKRKEETINKVLVIRDPVAYLESGLLNMIKNRLEYASNIKTLVKKYKVSTIEVHDSAAWFLFLEAKPPIFVRLHNGERYYKKRGLSVILLERLSFFFRRVQIIAVSNYILQEFKLFFRMRNFRNNYSVIYNGISFSDNIKEVFEGRSIVFAGTLKKIKGLDWLIKSFINSTLLESNYVLEIYGRDTDIYPGMSYWEYLLRDLPELERCVINGNIVYHGAVPNEKVINAFKNSAFCVFPSRMESFGLVVVEAMAVGALVIYSNQGPSAEIIDDGKNGFLVQVDNYMALSRKMEEVSRLSYQEKYNISRSAIEKAQSFSMKNCAEKSLSLYLTEAKNA